MDGQVNEQDLEGAEFLREHRSLLRRYRDAVERSRAAEVQVALLERRGRKAGARIKTLEASLERGQKLNERLAGDLKRLTLANADLYRQLTKAQDANTLLIGRAEEAQRLHAEAMRLIKEEILGRAAQKAARESLNDAAARSSMLTPEHGRTAAAFLSSAARVAASMTTGEYQTHINEVAVAAARIAKEPDERVWDTWASEAGRVGRKFSGAPAPEPGVRVDGRFERTATPQAERAVLVPLEGGHLRVQVVGPSDGSSPCCGFGVVHGGELGKARLGVDGLLALLPRHGAGSSLARDLLVRIASLDADFVLEGSSAEIGQHLGITAMKSTTQAALELVSAVSTGVRYDPLRSAWRLERRQLETVNVESDALDIEIMTAPS